MVFDSIRIPGSTALGLELWAWWPVTLKIEKPSRDNNFDWIIPPYGWFFHWPPWEMTASGEILCDATVRLKMWDQGRGNQHVIQ